MKQKTLALLAFGSAFASALAFGACSSGDDDITPLKDTGTKDTTTPPPDGSSSDAGTDSPVNPDGGDGGGGGADCAAPNSIFNTPEAGPYCPFQADSGFFPCNIGEHCCVYSVSSKLDSECKSGGQCNPAGMDGGGADFECNEGADCTSGGSPVCCLLGTVKQDAICKAIYFGSLVNGTKCRNGSCGTGEVQLCNSSDGGGCPSSTVCRPFKTKAISLGGCVP